MDSQAFLQIVSGVRAGTKIPIPEASTLVIGRKKGDLVLDDPLVSGVHARIIHKDNTLVLQDLGSTNGTIVDGRLIREIVIKPGMEITIGSCRMILFQGQESRTATKPVQPLEIAWLLDEELVDAYSVGDQTRGQGDVIGQDLRLPPGLNTTLECIAGVDVGKVFRFTRGTITIGRKAGEVPLGDPEVSRRHTVIEVFGRDMIYLRDLESTNGTYHNGRKVRLGRLQTGDTIGVGKTVLRLVIR